VSVQFLITSRRPRYGSRSTLRCGDQPAAAGSSFPVGINRLFGASPSRVQADTEDLQRYADDEYGTGRCRAVSVRYTVPGSANPNPEDLLRPGAAISKSVESYQLIRLTVVGRQTSTPTLLATMARACPSTTKLIPGRQRRSGRAGINTRRHLQGRSKTAVPRYPRRHHATDHARLTYADPPSGIPVRR
jgi:hypothetical protein